MRPSGDDPGSAEQQPPIVVENLTKRFGQFLAVDRVSFGVGRGEVYGWLGPNGAGKTTTIRMLLGLLKPSEGSCRVLGHDPATQAKAMQARVGYMSQLFTLYNDLTARENIRFYGQAYGLSPQELRRRQEEILQVAGLQGKENTLTRDLSGGWKQRLAFGCAIVHRPQVVFLDEPTAGVDSISRREFWSLVYAMAGDGVTVLVTTHYMDEAELRQRVGFISQGRLLALDTPEQLKRTQMRGQVLEVDCSPADAAMRVLLAAREGAPREGAPKEGAPKEGAQMPFEEVAHYGAQIHAVVPEAGAAMQPLRALLESQGIVVQAIRWIAPTLEDVFISVVRLR